MVSFKEKDPTSSASRRTTLGARGGDCGMNFKKVIIGTGVVMSLLLSTTPAFAHVVVKPNAVGVGAFQTFTVGVPNEKENPTVGLRLVIPEGLKFVSPNVKPGWTIDVKKTGDGDSAVVTEINWTGDAIPAGQRDDFVFSAQTPAKETTLIWKAYQTYENGDVVSWDQKPGENEDDESVTPYSQTKIINDLTGSDEHAMEMADEKQSLPISLSVVAILLAAVSLALQMRKR
jgi:uncharacterized protein YcnI